MAGVFLMNDYESWFSMAILKKGSKNITPLHRLHFPCIISWFYTFFKFKGKNKSENSCDCCDDKGNIDTMDNAACSSIRYSSGRHDGDQNGGTNRPGDLAECVVHCCSVWD